MMAIRSSGCSCGCRGRGSGCRRWCLLRSVVGYSSPFLAGFFRTCDINWLSMFLINYGSSISNKYIGQLSCFNIFNNFTIRVFRKVYIWVVYTTKKIK